MTVPVLKWSLKTSPPEKLQKDIPVPFENRFNLMERVIKTGGNSFCKTSGYHLIITPKRRSKIKVPNSRVL